jgi:hypothetical protein
LLINDPVDASSGPFDLPNIGITDTNLPIQRIVFNIKDCINQGNSYSKDLYEVLQRNIGKSASLQYVVDAGNYQSVATANFVIGSPINTISFITPQVISPSASSITVQNLTGYTGNVHFKLSCADIVSSEFLYSSTISSPNSNFTLNLSTFYRAIVDGSGQTDFLPDINDPLSTGFSALNGTYAWIEYSTDGTNFYGMGIPPSAATTPWQPDSPLSSANTSTFFIGPSVTYSTPSTLSVTASTLTLTTVTGYTGNIEFLLRINDPVDGDGTGTYIYYRSSSFTSPSSSIILNMTESDGSSEGWFNPGYSFNTYFAHNSGKYANIEYSTNSGGAWIGVGNRISTISSPPLNFSRSVTTMVMQLENNLK